MKCSKTISLLLFELKIQNRINNLIKYLVVFFLFAIVAITLLNKQEDVGEFGIIFSLIYYPLSLMGLASAIFKPDLDDGYLENLLVVFSPLQIILAKFGAFTICGIISLIINIPIIILIFNIFDLTLIMHLATCLLCLLFLSSSLLLLVGASLCYFRSNGNFISLIILPLLLPSIMISGLALQETSAIYLIYILLGINLIILPISLIFSSYLLKNIYNV
jgi:heme exporter protein B